jgi:hypothetical protein
VSAVIEPLQGTRNRECQEQAHQCKYGALDGGEARHGASIFLHVSQTELSPVVLVPEVGTNIPIRNCDYKLTQPELAYELGSRVSRVIQLSNPHKFMPHQSTKAE